MFCAECGTELKEGELFCPNCGRGVQIVPDYNPIEDFISCCSVENSSPKKATASSKTEELRQIIIFILVIIAGLSTWLAIALTGRNHRRNTSYEYQLSEAVQYAEEGDYEKAISYASRAAALLKDSENRDEYSEALKLSGELYSHEGDIKNALWAYKNALKAVPDDAEAYVHLILLYEEESDYKNLAALASKAEIPSVRERLEPYVVNDPKFSLEPGTYDEPLELSIESSPDDILYYTTDGTAPETAGTIYESPIALTEGTAIVRAIAVNSYGIPGNETAGTYTVVLPVPNAPYITPVSGSYAPGTMIRIDVPTDCTAYYTLDGSDPDFGSKEYDGPVPIPEGNHIFSAIIVNKYEKTSFVAKRSYNLK